jgi:hypothetical protein
VDGTRRPRRLAKSALEGIDAYLDMLRKAFETNYSRLDQLLAEMNPKNGDPQ